MTGVVTALAIGRRVVVEVSTGAETGAETEIAVMGRITRGALRGGHTAGATVEALRAAG